MKMTCVGKVVLAVLLLSKIAFATDVGGIISSNTTWNLAGSPYNVTGLIQIADGVTLTIDPGVTVEGNDNMIQLFGSSNLIAEGTSTSNIVVDYWDIRGGEQLQQAKFKYCQFNQCYISVAVKFLANIVKLGFVRLNLYDVDNPSIIYVRNNLFYSTTLQHRNGLDTVYIEQNIFNNSMIND